MDLKQHWRTIKDTVSIICCAKWVPKFVELWKKIAHRCRSVLFWKPCQRTDCALLNIFCIIHFAFCLLPCTETQNQLLNDPTNVSYFHISLRPKFHLLWAIFLLERLHEFQNFSKSIQKWTESRNSFWITPNLTCNIAEEIGSSNQVKLCADSFQHFCRQQIPTKSGYLEIPSIYYEIMMKSYYVAKCGTNRKAFTADRTYILLLISASKIWMNQ